MALHCLRTGIAALAALVGTVPLAAQTAAPAPPAAAGTAAEAPPPLIPSRSLVAAGGLSDMLLSPDGARIVVRATTAEGKVDLAVIDAATRAVLGKITFPPKTEMNWFRWAGNGKVLLSVSSTVAWVDGDARMSRLYYFDLAARALTMLAGKEQGLDGDDLLYTDPGGEYVLLSAQRTIYDYPSVWRFPLVPDAPRRARQVLDQHNGVWDWYADNAGTVRVGIAVIDSRHIRILYRASASESFRTVARLDDRSTEDDFIDVLRIVSGSDEGYVLKKDESGHVALRRFNYATRTAGETVYAAPGWDVSDAYIDEQNKVIAAYYTDDRDRVVWFDPKMKAMQARLERALKGSDVWVTSRARDDSRMLVWAGHEDDPGGYYIYTAARATLDPLVSTLPDLDPAWLARPRPIHYTARDKTEIHGYLTLPRGRTAKGLPLIIMPHGGPYWVRDKLVFDSQVQLLANRGYAVLQPNFRGSDGYGESFDNLGRGQIGRAMQDDLDDAMDWAVGQGIADARRVCVVGASYGGYAALWAVLRNPERYRCAASLAGVTDWKRQLKYASDFLAPAGRRSWRARVLGADDKFDLDQVSPVPQAARLTRPVLLAHGDADTRVPFRQFKAFRDATARSGLVESLVFPDEGHGFDKPADAIKWFDTLEAFLRRHNPPG